MAINMKIAIDSHTHTIASTHAYSTITEYATQAAKIGMRAFASTDHGPKLEDGVHRWHFMNMKILPRIIEGVIVLRGAECNIMDYNGTLDLPENILTQLDWVIASYHDKACPSGSIEENTNSYIEIAKNPLVDLIGHSESDEYKYDYEKALPFFKEYGKFLEINNHSMRIRAGSDKNCIELLKICKKIELPIVLNSDSHYHMQLGDVSLVDKALEAVNFPEKLIFNADFDRFIEHIEKKRNRKIK